MSHDDDTEGLRKESRPVPGEQEAVESQPQQLPCHLTVLFDPEKYSAQLDFPEHVTFADLVARLASMFGPAYDWDKSKALVSRAAAPPASSASPSSPTIKGLLKTPQDNDLRLHPAGSGARLKVMAPKRDAIQSLQQAARQAASAPAARHSRHARPPPGSRAAAVRTAAGQQQGDYAFGSIEPLRDLPHPERSRDFLARLAADRGIREAMRKHHFRVGLLAEMDPRDFTLASHEGVTRVLGLNRNRGEAILLRLRTDAFDGYRSYRVIRDTLCHELAHNVHGPHDRAFWDLCHQIQREVDAADWETSRHQLGDEEYAPARDGDEDEEEAIMEHGGWTGGTWVLGGGDRGGGRGGGATGPSADLGGLSVRERMARAAEKRRRDESKPADQEGGGGTK